MSWDWTLYCTLICCIQLHCCKNYKLTTRSEKIVYESSKNPEKSLGFKVKVNSAVPCLAMIFTERKLENLLTKRRYIILFTTSRVKKRVSERVSPGVMHIIRSETLGETLGETFWREKSCQQSGRESCRDSRWDFWRDSWRESRIGLYAWLPARLSPRLVFFYAGCTLFYMILKRLWNLWFLELFLLVPSKTKV